MGNFWRGGEGIPFVFVCGDLNDVSESRPFKILVGEDVERQGEGGEGEGAREERREIGKVLLRDSQKLAIFPPIGKTATFTGLFLLWWG